MQKQNSIYTEAGKIEFPVSEGGKIAEVLCLGGPN